MTGTTVFADDSQMGYADERRSFALGEALDFDAGYRLAHLPLVMPGHPLATHNEPASDYNAGTYAVPRYGLAIPIPETALSGSAGFAALQAEMKAASFAGKIAWSVGDLRAHCIHATVIGRISAASVVEVARVAGDTLSTLPEPMTVRLTGPFVGSRNHGRLYFPLYPRLVDGVDPFRRVQERLGYPASRMYLAGYYHLTDPLNAGETTDLAALMDRWRYRTVADVPVPSLDLHATNDDLALTARTWATIPVGPSTTIVALGGRTR